jgi:hypothetical protein
LRFNLPPEPPLNDCRATEDDAIETVPSTPNAVVEGIVVPLSSVNDPPPITEIVVDANEPPPVNVIDPDCTVVAPENEFAPLNVNAPTPTFSNEPVPLKIPAYEPFTTFRTVPSNDTTDPPAPFKVNKSTAAAENSTNPFAVNTVDVGNNAPPVTVSVAPPATVTSVDAKRPEPLNNNVPPFTLVDPL